MRMLVYRNMKIEIKGESISQLFKKLDKTDFYILHLFRQGATTRYQILMKTKPSNSKKPTIAKSTLYRRINDKLIPLGFLEEITKEPFEKGSLKLDKPVYSLTVIKGIMASTVYKNITLKSLSGWIRWLLQFNMDLSEVKVNLEFYIWTMLFALSDHPEWFPPKIRSFGETILQDFKKII